MQAETFSAWPIATLSRRGLLRGLLRGAAGGALLATLPRAARAQILHEESVVLTVLGILQPASTDDVICLLTVLFDTTDAESLGLSRPEPAEVASSIERLRASGAIVAVQEEPVPLFSVSAPGNARLNGELRNTRDKTRLFLLHGPRASIMERSREGREGVAGGASPLLRLRSHIERVGRPFGPTHLGSLMLPHAREHGAELWFRRCRTSPLVLSRDTALRFLSFDSLDDLKVAGGTTEQYGQRRITPEGVALCLGVSTDLLRWLRFDRRVKHYRHFTVPKRDGGKRRIESPRIFLKVVQRFILHFLLDEQAPHDAVYSFVSTSTSEHKRNAISNARRHVGHAYLAKIDIADFFGSLRHRHVLQVFRENGLVNGEASQMLAMLCTLPDERGPWTYLPQGAPTSPMISNLALRKFDQYLTAVSADLNLTYTRYADDIAVSGEDRRNVKLAALLAQRRLTQSPFSLTVQDRKSRFVTSAEQQRVTGVVVNEVGLPPRKLRRRVRAMFHQAALNPARLSAERARLRGYLNYFKAFPGYPQEELARYSQILRQ